jgi:hypothetical protein
LFLLSFLTIMSEFFPSRSPSPALTPEEHKTRLEGLWGAVMADLLIATHCHGCGIATPVALTGYTGTHCSKYCWKANELEAGYEFECMWGGCVVCDGGFVSLARPARHPAPTA